ncbi:MAG: phosphotransacetylase family protein, partial [Merismopedia sp. SIO2A8]|nr:phosphotransacetylase family protein [Merismopedia sp. SIO2A8]
KSTKYLLIGSAEAYSGKSATILGIGQQLIQQGLNIAYGKPLGVDEDDASSTGQDEDVRFIAETLNLTDTQIRPTVLTLTEQTIQHYMTNPEALDYRQRLQQYLTAPTADVALLEGPGTLAEGQLFGLSLAQSADVLDAQVLLVVRYHSATVVESILEAKRQLGDRLLGILINDIPETTQEMVKTTIVPFLEARGITTFGLLPSNDVLRSVSVGELVHQLNAEVLCCPDRMDLMVESLKIGAMNVNSALKYFRKAHNMAVVTGGDRTDLQLAALETSTHCLILTGHLPPMDTVRQRAEDLEIPVLSVDLDTLTTVEIIDQAFGQVRLHEAIKVQCVYGLMAEYFDLEQFMAALGLEPAVPA